MLTRDGSATFSYGVWSTIEFNAIEIFDNQEFPLALQFDTLTYDAPAEIFGGDERKVTMIIMVDANDPDNKCRMTFEHTVDYEIRGKFDPVMCSFEIDLEVGLMDTRLVSSECPEIVTQVNEPTGAALGAIVLQPQVANGEIAIVSSDYDPASKGYGLSFVGEGSGGGMGQNYLLSNIDLPEAHTCSEKFGR